MADEKQPEKMVKVKVRVPSRESQGFPGFWSVGQFFPNGDSEAVIPESKLEELKAETMLVVLDVSPADGGASKPEPVSAPAQPAAESTAQPSPAKPFRK